MVGIWCTSLTRRTNHTKHEMGINILRVPDILAEVTCRTLATY
jgi:hypothetical protein